MFHWMGLSNILESVSSVFFVSSKVFVGLQLAYFVDLGKKKTKTLLFWKFSEN